jgi:hypothetical protein
MQSAAVLVSETEGDEPGERLLVIRPGCADHAQACASDQPTKRHALA